MIGLKIWHDIIAFKAENPVITIGSFDGVHRGHLEVINQLKFIADEVNGESVVFTFSPHPSSILAPDKELVLLTTLEERITLFSKTGIDHLIIFPFTREFSDLSYEQFVKTILVDQLHIHTLLLGYDNKIGHGRQGNYEQLAGLSEKLGFEIRTHKALKIDHLNLSSTHIRKLLSQGYLYEASKLLGYPFLISGTVVHGKSLGNKLGFPTANLLPPDRKFVPANGVYAVLVEYKHQTYKGMMNIGVRPTIEDYATKPILEVHLFNFSGNLYGEWVQVSIYRKIRDEFKFDSIEALREQLKKDKLQAELILEKEFGLEW